MADGVSARGNCCVKCTLQLSNKYERAVTSVQGKLNRATGAIGAFVTRRPVWVVILSILAAAAAGAGWARFRIESSTDKLWVPQESQAMKDEDWVSAIYASGGGGAQVMGSVLPSRQLKYGNNTLQLAVFWELFQVDAAVRGISVASGGRTYKWTDVCEVDFDGKCKYSGPLNLWSMSFNTYLTDVNGSTMYPTAGDPQKLIEAVNRQHFPDNTSMSTLSIFGGITLSQVPNAIAGQPNIYMSAAQVVSLPYKLRDNLDADLEDKWYDKFLELLKEKTSTENYTALAYIAGNSVGDEIGRSVTNDLYLIIISVAIFILVAVIGLSRCHLVGTRSSLALLGVVSSVLAMVAGYGFSLLFGCPFNTLSQTLPYVLLGLSVDCMFILVKAYDMIAAAAEPGVSLEARFRSLMSSAGSNVVVTLLASAVAFGLGAISELPAVQWFSAYATMGVLCILIATLTFFTGVFVLTERRIARNRLDCCCCVTSGGPLLPTAATVYLEPREGSCRDPSREGGACCKTTRCKARSHPNPEHQNQNQQVLQAIVITPPPPPKTVAPPPQAPLSRGPMVESVQETALVGPYTSGQQGQSQGLPPAGPAEPNPMKYLFGHFYAPMLTKWYVKVIVLAIFIGWAVLSGVGIPRLKEGQPLSELAPDDSYLQAYVAITTDTFDQQIGSPASLYFRWLDPSSPQQQSKMLKALAATLENEFVNSTVSAFQGNWLIDFIEWVQQSQPSVKLVALDGCSNPFSGRVSGDLAKFVKPKNISGCVPEDAFYPMLETFLATHRGYLEDIKWTDGGTSKTVWSCRLSVVHTGGGGNGAYGRELITSIRDLEGDINNGIYAAENEGGAPGNVFLMYNGDYIYDSGDAILGTMTMEYVLLAVAGVGLVLTLTLPSVRAVVLMMVSVGLVDYFLFGQMFILDLRFNQVSIINMIMATGLSVDYSVYFAQRFVQVTADGTLNGRMVVAMTDTGSAVFLGGLTALTGTIPLAFSSSTILRVFFSLIFGTICFALLVGLMLMPVVFSLVGPPTLRQKIDATDAPCTTPPGIIAPLHDKGASGAQEP